MTFRPPLDYALIRQTICDLVASATGLGSQQIVMAEPEEAGAPIPDFPFVMFQFTTIAERMGRDSLLANPFTGDFELSGPRRAYVNFDVYGQSHDEAYSLAGLLQAGLHAPAPQDVLRRANMAIWRTGPVVDLSALLSTGFEGRARIDVQFGLSSVLGVNLQSIESADIAGTITDGGDQIAVALTKNEA